MKLMLYLLLSLSLLKLICVIFVNRERRETCLKEAELYSFLKMENVHCRTSR